MKARVFEVRERDDSGKERTHGLRRTKRSAETRAQQIRNLNFLHGRSSTVYIVDVDVETNE